MKALLEFFQSLGLAEILITFALIAICVVAWYDCKFTDEKYDADNKRLMNTIRDERIKPV